MDKVRQLACFGPPCTNTHKFIMHSTVKHSLNQSCGVKRPIPLWSRENGFWGEIK